MDTRDLLNWLADYKAQQASMAKRASFLDDLTQWASDHKDELIASGIGAGLGGGAGALIGAGRDEEGKKRRWTGAALGALTGGLGGFGLSKLMQHLDGVEALKKENERLQIANNQAYETAKNFWNDRDEGKVKERHDQQFKDEKARQVLEKAKKITGSLPKPKAPDLPIEIPIKAEPVQTPDLGFSSNPELDAIAAAQRKADEDAFQASLMSSGEGAFGMSDAQIVARDEAVERAIRNWQTGYSGNHDKWVELSPEAKAILYQRGGELMQQGFPITPENLFAGQFNADDPNAALEGYLPPATPPEEVFPWLKGLKTSLGRLGLGGTEKSGFYKRAESEEQAGTINDILAWLADHKDELIASGIGAGVGGGAGALIGAGSDEKGEKRRGLGALLGALAGGAGGLGLQALLSGADPETAGSLGGINGERKLTDPAINSVPIQYGDGLGPATSAVPYKKAPSNQDYEDAMMGGIRGMSNAVRAY